MGILSLTLGAGGRTEWIAYEANAPPTQVKNPHIRHEIYPGVHTGLTNGGSEGLSGAKHRKSTGLPITHGVRRESASAAFELIDELIQPTALALLNLPAELLDGLDGLTGIL